MEVTETKTETKTVTETHVLGIKCDVCGKVSPRRDSWSGHHQTEEFQLKGEESDYYCGETVGKRTRVDFCPECFENLISELKAKGVSVSKEEL